MSFSPPIPPLDFLEIKTKKDLASFLGISIRKLDYNAYSTENRYNIFNIKKRNGENRKILAPIGSLKQIQKKLSETLSYFYSPKKHVHGYIKGKSIKTNALIHSKQTFVINLDLENYFQSINFGRVRGMFQSYPFCFNDKISSLLAQICCHQNELPQGSPTSPIISNFISRNLDNKLKLHARLNKCYYSRYSDDITFSTSLKKIPKKIGYKTNKGFKLNNNIIEIIKNNGFDVNLSKVSIRNQNERQYVTGLTVNKKVNIKKSFLKKLRAMLHSWEVRGLDKASSYHFKQNPHKSQKKTTSLFINIIEGKLLFIADIRGKNDLLFQSLLSKFEILKPDNSLKRYLNYNGEKILIFTEGNTDWIHLKHALNSLSVVDYQIRNLKKSIKIIEYEENYSVGDTKLKNILESHLISTNKKPIIGIFDSDNLHSLGQFKPNSGFSFKNFNDVVFSFYLPQPTHRKIDKICIEHYYKNQDLMIMDENGRRIFLSNEFDQDTGVLKSNNEIKYIGESLKKLKNPELIIDSRVFGPKEKSYALSKKDFAKNILNKEERFKKVNVESFRLIFDQIILILKHIKQSQKDNSI